MIRALIYVVAILLLANAAVLMWPDQINSAAHIYAAKDDVNPHFVRLNKEIEARFYNEKQAVVVLDPDLSVANVNPEVNEEGCYRIGPFMHQANFELAQAVLFNAGVTYQKSKRASKESSVYRVFIGPYENQAQVADARLELRRKKVLDHFVRKQLDDSIIISLGIYSSSESADTAVRLFADTLGVVQKQGENVVLPDSYWLHFGGDTDSKVRQQMTSMDWGEPSAKMGLFECGN